MATTREKLEFLFSKVRILPPERQQLALDALAEIAEDAYSVSDEELVVREPFSDAERNPKSLCGRRRSAHMLAARNPVWCYTAKRL